MVGRFESPELQRETRRYEQFSSNQGLCGRCSCLVGTIFTIVGFISPIVSLDSLFGGGPVGKSPVPHPETQFSSYHVYEHSRDTDAFYAVDSLYPRQREDSGHLSFDSTLVFVVIAVVAICVFQPCLRGPSGYGQEYPPANGGPLRYLWELLGCPPPLQSQSLLVPGGQGGASQMPNFGDGRAGFGFDVKPGELRGSVGGSLFGQPWQTGGKTGAMMAWNGTGSAWAGATPTAGGSWGTPVPSSQAALGSRTPSFGGQGGFSWPSLGGIGGTIRNLASLSPLGLGGSWGGVGSCALPTEAEVTETYAFCGVELQQWVPAIVKAIEFELLGPLIRSLDSSDRELQPALQQRGWKLTCEAPRFPGVGPPQQELSVFDRHLPRPFMDDPRSVEFWNNRQRLESYLVHPFFEPSQRAYVLDRLQTWHQRGLMNAMQYDLRPNEMMPTDAHIFENLVIKMLNGYMEFAQCFLAAGHAPPQGKHLGQSQTAFLRQVTDQNLFPKPPPHYEVLIPTRVFKLKPGNSNLAEALGLLLHTLRKNSPRSYQAFPQSLRAAVESSPGATAMESTRVWY